MNLYQIVVRSAGLLHSLSVDGGKSPMYHFMPVSALKVIFFDNFFLTIVIFFDNIQTHQ